MPHLNGAAFRLLRRPRCVMRGLALAALAFASVPGLAYGHGFAGRAPTAAAGKSGTLSVCNASGARPVTSPFAYTLAAPGSAGGSQTFTIAVGACSPPVFYPIRTAVVVTEQVPTGSAVTSISISPAGASTIASKDPAGGTATVTIRSGQSRLTFTTSGPSGPDCDVPNVLGLTLAGARATLARSHCTLGRVSRAYSPVSKTGRVIASRPKHGLVLAHDALVALTVGLGPKP